MARTFNPAAFNALLSVTRPGLGQNILWARSFLCPCRSATSGAALQGCPVCGGRGVVWDEATSAWTALAGMKIVREWASFGEWEGGDVIVTIPSDSPFYAAGETDKVLFTDSSEPFSSIVMSGVDFLPFSVVSFDRVTWKDPATHLLVSGSIPTQALDGTLDWSAFSSGGFSAGFSSGFNQAIGAAPPLGVQYSVSGRKIPAYFLFRDLVQDRHHSAGLPLPRRCVLRKFDLFGR